MAAPNLKSPATITGKIQPYVVTTSLASALSNGSSSGQCLRINAIRIANTGSSGAITISVTVYRGSTHTYLIKAASVAQASGYVVLQRDEFLYLEEGDAIYIQASAATADALITYDIWA